MKKKVLCVVGDWESGGVESFFSRLYQTMDLSNLQIDIAANLWDPNSVFNTVFKQKNIRRIQYGFSRKYIFRLVAIFKLFPLLLRNKYDVIHSNVGSLNVWVILMGFCLRVKKRVAHIHIDITPLPGCYRQWLKYILGRLSAFVLACVATDLLAVSSKAGKAFYGKHCQFSVIRNGIILRDFQFLPQQRSQVRKQNMWEDQLIIANVGRLDRNKNQIFLLDLLQQLLIRHPQTYLILIGNGDIVPDLKAKAKQLGVEQRLFFKGQVKQVASILQGADVFVLPSLKEGLGISVIEAQCCGLPCFVSDGIPQEALICNTTQIELSKSAEEWAEIILNRTKNFYRQDCTKQIKEAGFDICDTARQIKEIYL